MRKILAALGAAAVLAVVVPAHAAAPADYAVTGWSGPATVAQGQTFTRTLTITNIGASGGTWPITATVNQVAHADFVSATGPGFVRCAATKFSSGALNYVRCTNAYLAPGQSVTMTVTYRAPLAGWVGWVYTGGGRVDKTSMELESSAANNYSGVGVTTTVVP